MVCRDRSTDVRFCVRRTTLFGPFLLIFVDFHHSAVTSIFSHSNFSNFKMLYLIEFESNKNSEQYDRQQISAQTKHIAQIFNFSATPLCTYVNTQKKRSCNWLQNSLIFGPTLVIDQKLHHFKVLLAVS